VVPSSSPNFVLVALILHIIGWSLMAIIWVFQMISEFVILKCSKFGAYDSMNRQIDEALRQGGGVRVVAMTLGLFIVVLQLGVGVTFQRMAAQWNYLCLPFSITTMVIVGICTFVQAITYAVAGIIFRWTTAAPAAPAAPALAPALAPAPIAPAPVQ
jgi:hypothetical protein